MTSKERAYLRSLASNIDTILQVGKGGIPQTLVEQVDGALKKRELIKLSVLDTCEYTAREAAQELAAATNSEPVQVIGRKFVLFRQNKNPKERVIEIKI